EHHAVAQPFHRAATATLGLPLYERSEARRELSGGIVAALLGEARVAGEVEKHHRRRRPLPPGRDARLLERLLDMADDVLDDRVLLMAVIQPVDHPLDLR